MSTIYASIAIIGILATFFHEDNTVICVNNLCKTVELQERQSDKFGNWIIPEGLK